MVKHNPEEVAKLRALATEIKELFIKHDVAGCVNIQGIDSAEFLIHIETSWSVLKWEVDKDGKVLGFRFKAQLATAPPELKDVIRENARRTVSMVMGFLDILAITFAQFEKLRVMMTKHFKIQHDVEPVIPPPPAAEPPPKA